MTDNLRAVVSDVSARARSSEDGVKPSGGPVSKKPDPKLSITWKVDNPDKDDMRYRLKYRLVRRRRQED